jgi:uncharacterized protein YodC (DUF2158 family)
MKDEYDFSNAERGKFYRKDAALVPPKMTNVQFKPGDTVRLKSGGPLMTVEKFETDELGTPTVWVVWFEENKPMREHYGAASVTADDGVPHIA